MYYDLNPLCLMASKTRTAADTETFKESIFPCMGILIIALAACNQKELSPAASVPMTIAEALVKSADW